MRQSVRILSLIVTLPITLLVVLFAISNLDQITLHLYPFPFDMPIQIWALTLIELFIGFLLGAIVTWIGYRHRRRENRLLTRRNAELEQSLAGAQTRAAELEAKLTEDQARKTVATAA
jgi:uncharacterized integral membrane protein